MRQGAELTPAWVRRGEKLDLDQERRVRTPADMAAEAAELRELFQ